MCTFRSTKEAELVNHIQPGVYPLHQESLEDLKEKGAPVDFTKMLMKSLSSKFLKVDYICLSLEKSMAEWSRRKRPSGLPVQLYRQGDRQEITEENVLSSILGNYDPDERLTPSLQYKSLPVLTRQPGIPGYSPVTFEVNKTQPTTAAVPSNSTYPSSSVQVSTSPNEAAWHPWVFTCHL